tara:strand:+ start:50 stop:781 length:732 start_codon:yes stop_codon:yes gene_type:complete
LSWTNYIDSPDNLYPNEIVYDAYYDLYPTYYISKVLKTSNSGFYFSHFTNRVATPNFYTNATTYAFKPVFDSIVFGPNYVQKTHSYKSTTGVFDTSQISWTSSYKVVSTQEYNVFFGAISNYKNFIRNNGAGAISTDAIMNQENYSFITNLYNPGGTWFGPTGSFAFSLKVTLKQGGPAFSDPNTEPDPDPDGPTPNPSDPTFDVYLLDTDDGGILLDDSPVAAATANYRGWTISGGKCFIFF